MSDTIFALSSGRPPAAIAIVRISGPNACDAATALAGSLPAPRHAALRRLRTAQGATLDHALVLVFPGPATATGEDLVELHLHGGRAVIAAVEAALDALPHTRRAEPGEFTRRALLNDRLDLAQAEGLADLLEAETEQQRRAAIDMAEGGLSRTVAGWLDRLAMAAALVEAGLDFGDEDDVAGAPAPDIRAMIAPIAGEIATVLARPSVERLRDGLLVVLAGPRNAGKSSLFNALLGREAAIVTDIAGTTRDVLEASVVRSGMAFRLVDTAGLTEQTDDPIEAIGIARAQTLMSGADVVLWLGDPDHAPPAAIRIGARHDERCHDPAAFDLTTSTSDMASIDRLWDLLAMRAEVAAGSGTTALHQRQRDLIATAARELAHVDDQDALLDAERIRVANKCLAAILGRDATEAMLDALFGRFCLGK
ncbi:tRNA uridine-5-carboxymethylaminomethyl(34) synthesis GTPase MnmE [uncultured Sphingomonas sp.]|uniref:tRNA uridine-5-carboxymethylaminomethyl(34) synthesis GTPase MnmE n=1 Tax=uncultured Sphingomonas sp. TaxID=158754 RepID=UPI0025F1A229|nr:tRNA uridine-5-carboxymethylaminomethyl(34) synthesis GTPase MnmE [uncultured Sphingomonas sp.]